jgi:hypothetical protein
VRRAHAHGSPGAGRGPRLPEADAPAPDALDAHAPEAPDALTLPLRKLGALAALPAWALLRPVPHALFALAQGPLFAHPALAALPAWALLHPVPHALFALAHGPLFARPAEPGLALLSARSLGTLSARPLFAFRPRTIFAFRPRTLCLVPPAHPGLATLPLRTFTTLPALAFTTLPLRTFTTLPALAAGARRPPAARAPPPFVAPRHLGRHALQCVARRRLLGLLLVATAAVAQGPAADHDLDGELLEVVGAVLLADAVHRVGVEGALHVLLQQALVVRVPLVGGDLAGLVQQPGLDELARRLQPLVDVDGPDHGLEGVGQDGQPLPSTRLHLGVGQQDEAPQSHG